MNGGVSTSARFLFVIWEKARRLEPQLIEAISSRFKVIEVHEITWPRRYFTANLAAFYGWKGWFCWWNKARKCGRGPFLAIEAEDPQPRWIHGRDTSGHDLVLDANVNEAKHVLRAMTGHSNRVHASMTCEETVHEFAALASTDTDGSIRFVPFDYAKEPRCDSIVLTGLSAAEIGNLLVEGKLERIGMGSRRACYRLPDGKHCLKCYRSDAEIEEGKYPGATPPKPLAAGAVREIRRCRFDERRNTCCQEYRYWLKLGKRLPPDLMQVFPATIEMVRIPSRGWGLVEELVVNADGSTPRKFAEEWRSAAAGRRRLLFSAFDRLAKSIVRHAVRFYDPQNILVQNLGDGSFRLRITDFEPASRLLVPIDALPFVSDLKVRRRFDKYCVQNGVAMPSGIDGESGGAGQTAGSDKKVNVLCLKWGAYYGPEYVNRLYAGVKRNLRRPFRFVCVTDNPEGLAAGIDAVPFPPPPPGWKWRWPNIFAKLCVFQDGFAGLKGTTLFLDVDQVITGSLDRFFDYMPGEFCIVRNWIEWRKRIFRKRPMVGNSSCFRFEAGGMNHVYEKFLAERNQAVDGRLFRTEQAFMTYAVGLDSINWWPSGWVASFKRSCLWMFPLNLLLRPRLPPKGSSILCFHGNPSPQEAIDGYRGKKGHIEQRTRPAPWIGNLWTGGKQSGCRD